MDYRKDSFFKEDELISTIKMPDNEKTNWRRIKNKSPVISITYYK